MFDLRQLLIDLVWQLRIDFFQFGSVRIRLEKIEIFSHLVRSHRFTPAAVITILILISSLRRVLADLEPSWSQFQAQRANYARSQSRLLFTCRSAAQLRDKAKHLPACSRIERAQRRRPIERRSMTIVLSGRASLTTTRKPLELRSATGCGRGSSRLWLWIEPRPQPRH